MARRMKQFGAMALLLGLGACHAANGTSDGGGDEARRAPAARGFPRATRPIASSTDTGSATSEAQRDAAGEAAWVMNLAGVRPGMRLADIGAGEGYYTVRLSPVVGRKGRVLAEDIDAQALSRLGARVERERLDNVSIQLGDAVDPHLPPASFDRVMLVHVYSQVAEPSAFLWYLRGGLRAGGSVVVVEDDAPRDAAGGRDVAKASAPASAKGSAAAPFAIAPAQLFCEFSALGFRLIQFATKSDSLGYYAQFEAIGDRPEPAGVKACVNSAVFSPQGG